MQCFVPFYPPACRCSTAGAKRQLLMQLDGPSCTEACTATLAFASFREPCTLSGRIPSERTAPAYFIQCRCRIRDECKRVKHRHHVQTLHPYEAQSAGPSGKNNIRTTKFTSYCLVGVENKIGRARARLPEPMGAYSTSCIS